MQISILLFADDACLLSFSVIGLQRQLNILRDTSEKMGLTVNPEKSKIVVFRNGGYIAAKEKWFFGDVRLEIVNQYKYLGVIFSCSLTFSYTMEDRAAKAKKGIICILKLLWSLGEKCPKLFFKLFDCQIQPMLTYGSEVWGLSADHTLIERAHLFGLKRLLNVSIKTPSNLVYGETGRYPLYIQTNTRCVKYWLKITRMPEERLPVKAYKMLIALHSKNHNNWVSSVCFTLYKYGFGHVWENQGVQDVTKFLNEFKQRLIDCFVQGWHSEITSNDRYMFYSSLKEIPTHSPYLIQLKHWSLRKVLTRFRLGVSGLQTHRYRYSKNVSLDCPFCKHTQESEVHFMLICPMYTELREKYIHRKYRRDPSLFKLTLLLCSDKCVKDVALFLTEAFKVRSQALPSVS